LLWLGQDVSVASIAARPPPSLRTVATTRSCATLARCPPTRHATRRPARRARLPHTSLATTAVSELNESPVACTCPGAEVVACLWVDWGTRSGRPASSRQSTASRRRRASRFIPLGCVYTLEVEKNVPRRIRAFQPS
jgi:hypothetical protein